MSQSVGAVVVNYNGADRVLRAIEALLAQTTPLEDIVVVDNQSTDGSPDQILETFPSVRLLALPSNVGLPAARNAGIRELGCEYVLLVDHDIYLEPDGVCRLLESFEAPDVAVVCPRTRLLPQRDIIQMEGAAPHFLGTLTLRHGYQPVDRIPIAPGYVDGVTGGCLLVDRRRILSAGGFDPLFFFYFEDLEFSLRLRALGEKLWCQPRAEAFHEPAEGTPGLSFRGHGSYPARRGYYTVRNRLLAILIHYRLRTIILLLPVLVLYECATVVLAFRRKFLSEWMRAWKWLFKNRSAISERRRNIQGQRLVNDRNILSGGEPPLAPGVATSGAQRWLVAAFSAAVNGYWRHVRRLIG
jgi:GT2 family glycosyltransferase